MICSTWGMVFMPFAMLTMVPFGWVLAWYQNLCIVDLNSCSLKEAHGQAKAYTRPWPKQNHYVISILYGFGYLVFLNLITVLVQLPGLLKSLVGLETEFTMSYHWIGNTTFLSVVLGLTYLLVDPFIKSAYVLRYYACETIRSGDDLVAELRRNAPRRRTAGLAGLVLILLLTMPAGAGEQAPPAEVNVQQLDETVQRVLQDEEFTWRMPKEFAPDEGEGKGFLADFWYSVGEWIGKVMEHIGDSMEKFFEWLGDMITPKHKRQPRTGGVDPAFFKGLSIFVLVVLGAVLIILLVRALLGRRAGPPRLQEVKTVNVGIDLEDENIIATLLPEDEWIQMARGLMEKGELRAAMRAWFLAVLAYLSRVNLVSVLQSKSNLEYARELVRRSRRHPGIATIFSDSIFRFERAWYGMHELSIEDLKQVEDNLERMRKLHEA